MTPSPSRDVDAPLTEEQAAAFAENGFVLLPGYFDVEREIEPIRRGIHQIIGEVATSAGVEIDRVPYDPATFDAGYDQLRRHDRALAGVVYDAAKQLAPFVRLTAAERNEATFRQLRQCSLVGVAGGGSGIRIDNPDETRYMAWWHQEYPAQRRSLEGVVFWSPLREVTPESGPVEVCVASHRDGLRPIVVDDDGDARVGAYALRLVDEARTVGCYEKAAPTSTPGDVLLLDFLTLHRSGVNRSVSPRWTMQMRYFGFEHRSGASIGWSGPSGTWPPPADVSTGSEIEGTRP